MSHAIRVLVVDDHDIVRTGLTQILECDDIQIVGEAKDGFEAINKALELRPDVILMDIFMPNCDGLEAMTAIQEELPDTKVLILTVSEQEQNLFQALRSGAQGYLLKSANIVEIASAVRMVAAGETMLSHSMVARLVAEFREKARQPTLSTREKEVLQLLGKGLSNSEIASSLFIDDSTVRTYVNRILTKLSLRNRAEAIAYAIHHVLASDPS